MLSHRHDRKPSPGELRSIYLEELAKVGAAKKERAQHELHDLMCQINRHTKQERKKLQKYKNAHKTEDIRSALYYHMLCRIGLPEVHARYVPWFLKSDEVKLGRLSSMLYSRLERAYFDKTVQVSKLENVMLEHQEEYDSFRKIHENRMSHYTANSSDFSNNKCKYASLNPRDQFPLLFRRAFRDCSFNISTDDNDVTLCSYSNNKNEIDNIPEIAVKHAAPGLAPQVRGTLESHGKHLYFQYVGRWKGGQMHGNLGVYRYSDGGKYHGEWMDSLPHGRGVMTYPNGVTYTGEFAKGKSHGYGIQELPQRGIKYIGNFVSGNRSGEGKLTIASNISTITYEGTFFKNMKHGYGQESNTLGYAYVGEWSENRICGNGTLTFPDKIEYKKSNWPTCILGEAIRIIKQENILRKEQEKIWMQQLCRVRDDLRALDLQKGYWNAEAKRLAKVEKDQLAAQKKSRKELLESRLAARKNSIDTYTEINSKNSSESDEEFSSTSDTSNHEDNHNDANSSA